jgi:DNA polymerase-4
MEREILHINTDDFYASVMRLRDPALRGQAVVVAGPAPRGMVFSASYEARREGVSRGMTVSRARRLCTGAAFLPPDWTIFRKASRAVFGVLRRYSPAVEPRSLDEGYIDYTGCGRLFGHVLDAGSSIKKEILRETGLEVSLGVATSKLVSHVASRTAKCAHLVDVYPGYESSFLAPVPIHRFPLVDEKRAAMLGELGISRVGDIRLFTEEVFSVCFGSWGRRLYRGAGGEDPSPVRSRPAPDERFTAEELLEPDRVQSRIIESVLYRLSERVCARLRSECSLAGSLLLEIRYADGVTVRGTGRPPQAVSDDSLVFDTVLSVLSRLYKRRVRVRHVRLAAGRIEAEPLQIDLFARESAAERRRRLHSALDTLRDAFPDGVAPAFGRALPGLRARNAGVRVYRGLGS